MTASNATNVRLTKDTLIITIATTTDEENLIKSLLYHTPPKTTQNQSIATGKNTTKIVDILNQAERRITIDGFLVTGLGDTDSSNDAEGKKTDLRNAFFAGGTITMLYEGSNIEINMDKLSIRRVNTDGLVAPDGVIQFSIKFTCVVGESY